MKLSRFLLGALLPVLALSGCASSRMYQGPALDRSELALLFIQERPNSKYRLIDGTPVNYVYDGRVLEFAPGKHVFEVELNTFRATGWPIVTYTRNYLIGTYELSLDMRPGHTYVLDFQQINIHTLPETLCFFGEPHDAPGSSVSLTGEYRIVSPNVEKLACAKAKSVRRNEK